MDFMDGFHMDRGNRHGILETYYVDMQQLL
jgi:hypothetical protein